MYSRRIARILSRLQRALSVKEYLHIAERFGMVDEFDMLSKEDKQTVIDIENGKALNYNKNHDGSGRFSSGPGGSLSSGSKPGVGDSVDISGRSKSTDLLSGKATVKNINSMPSEYFDQSLISREGDGALGAIYDKQGFHAKPRVLSSDNFNKYAVTNKTNVIYRGLSNKSHVEQFKAGKTHFPGVGVMGNGTYTTTNLDYALLYGQSSRKNVLRMSLSKDAKVGDFSKLKKDAESYISNLNNDAVKVKPGNNFSKKVFSLYDVGRFAALRGYDAYTAPGNITIILNRGKVLIDGDF